MKKIPVRRKCKNHSLCRQHLRADMIVSDPLGSPVRIFCKTIALFRCPVCDEAPDPGSREMHERLTDESGTMEA